MNKREAVKELYRKAYGNRIYEEYAGFLIYENMGFYFKRWNEEGASPQYPNATTITFDDECSDLKQSVRNEITALGFSLVDVVHKVPTNGTLYDRRCYIKWQGQHFSREDLFLDRIKELAELLGYDVRSVSKPPYWGIYGDTSSDAFTATITRFVCSLMARNSQKARYICLR